MPKLVLEFGDNNTKQNFRIIDMEGRGLPKDLVLEQITGYDTLGTPIWGAASACDDKSNVEIKKPAFQSLLYALSYFYKQLTAKPELK
jgi:hypothetical protein